MPNIKKYLKDCYYGKEKLNFSIRITESLKKEIDQMPEAYKHELIEAIRLQIKKTVHASKFDPRIYPD